MFPRNYAWIITANRSETEKFIQWWKNFSLANHVLYRLYLTDRVGAIQLYGPVRAVLMAKEARSIQNRCYSPSLNVSGQTRPWRPQKASRIRKLDGRLTLVICTSPTQCQTFGFGSLSHITNTPCKDEARVHRSVFPGGVCAIGLSRVAW